MEADYRSAIALIAQQSKDGIDALRKLSARGFAPASYDLGNCYYIGQMIEKSEHKAVEKWRDASAGGHVLGSMNVLKYEWYFAGLNRRIYLSALLIKLGLWGCYLTLKSGGQDVRLLGNTDRSLRIGHSTLRRQSTSNRAP